MIAYKTYENNIIFSISENVMHHFLKRKTLFISLKYVFHCPNSICIHIKISCACHILSISNLFPIIKQRLLLIMVQNMNGFVDRLMEKIDHFTYFSNTPRKSP